MIVRAITTVAFLSIAACIVLAICCGANGIRSMDDFRNFRAMQSVSDPVVVALADGSLMVGSTTQQMLAIDTPCWTKSYGRCEIHGFTPERSSGHQTVVTVDGRVVSAHVGSCTWRWSFFDEIPDDVAESVGSIRGLRDTIERIPEHTALLQPLLDDQLALLGMQLAEADAKAEQ